MSVAPAAPPVLRMAGVSKSFGATRALDDVTFELGRGEVHALIGENGAGKSTMMKILSGAIPPDAGRMEIDGRPYAPAGPGDGLRSGVSMIYQELNLAPHLTVEENIMLGREVHAAGWLDRGTMMRQVREVLELVRHPEISPGVPVGRLSVGARQLVEIARALLGKARILVMDEPTSSLSQEDSLRLFEIIRGLQGQDVSVIYISHLGGGWPRPSGCHWPGARSSASPVSSARAGPSCCGRSSGSTRPRAERSSFPEPSSPESGPGPGSGAASASSARTGRARAWPWACRWPTT